MNVGGIAKGRPNIEGVFYTFLFSYSLVIYILAYLICKANEIYTISILMTSVICKKVYYSIVGYESRYKCSCHREIGPGNPSAQVLNHSLDRPMTTIKPLISPMLLLSPLQRYPQQISLVQRDPEDFWVSSYVNYPHLLFCIRANNERVYDDDKVV